MEENDKHHHLPAQVRGAMRIVCPGCQRPTRSHLGGSGWTVTWCNRCRQWFRTANEMLTPQLMAFYQLTDLSSTQGET
ncbi:MAG: hypothetical protein KCHDKBKB_01547 [Elusimicrobia bacterium]|nr:hypothetical protein [Elusimicrobiota bacterium]